MEAVLRSLRGATAADDAILDEIEEEKEEETDEVDAGSDEDEAEHTDEADIEG